MIHVFMTFSLFLKHQVQLTEFIPSLVQLSTGRDVPLFGQNQFRPEWWPNEIPWVDPGLKDSKEEVNGSQGGG